MASKIKCFVDSYERDLVHKVWGENSPYIVIDNSTEDFTYLFGTYDIIMNHYTYTLFSQEINKRRKLRRSELWKLMNNG